MSDDVKAYRAKLSDFQQLPDNPNMGSERGQFMLEQSFEQYGAGRSVLAGADNVLIAGNHASEVYGQTLGDDVIVVETDGSQLVVVKRTDITSDSPQGLELAISDNRTQQVGFVPDWSVLEKLKERGADLSKFWHIEELNELKEDAQESHVNYSRKIDVPVYEPSNQKPNVDDLYDSSRTQELVSAIEDSNLTEGEKHFLIIAAQRHTILRFDYIADYYARSDPEMQKLMEDSALVIIDFDRAIELGFVKLTKQIQDLVKQDYDE